MARVRTSRHLRRPTAAPRCRPRRRSGRPTARPTRRPVRSHRSPTSSRPRSAFWAGTALRLLRPPRLRPPQSTANKTTVRTTARAHAHPHAQCGVVIHVFSRRVACAGAGSQQQAPPPQEEEQQDQWWTEKGWCDENGLWWSEEEWAKFYEEERLRKVHTHARAQPRAHSVC